MKGTQNKEAAWTFLKFLASKEASVYFAEQGGTIVPGRKSVANSDSYLSNAPEGSLKLYDALDYATPIPSPDKGNVVQSAIQDAFLQILTGAVDAGRGAQRAQRRNPEQPLGTARDDARARWQFGQLRFGRLAQQPVAEPPPGRAACAWPGGRCSTATPSSAPRSILFVVFIAGPLLGAIALSFYQVGSLQTASSSAWRTTASWQRRPSPERRNPQLVRFRLRLDRAPHRRRLAARPGRQPGDARRPALFPAHRLLLPAAHLVGLGLADLALCAQSELRLLQLLPSPELGLDPPNWLVDKEWAMPALLFVDLWRTLGFTFIILLAGLQGVPRSLYEAAMIDGAGAGPSVPQHHAADDLADALLRAGAELHRRVPDLRADVHHDQRRSRRQHPQSGPAHLRDRVPLVRDGLRLGDGDRRLRGDHGRHAAPVRAGQSLGAL